MDQLQSQLSVKIQTQPMQLVSLLLQHQQLILTTLMAKTQHFIIHNTTKEEMLKVSSLQQTEEELMLTYHLELKDLRFLAIK